MTWKRLDFSISISEKFPMVAPQAVIVWGFILPHSDAIGVYPLNYKLIKSQCLPLFGYRDDQIYSWVVALEEAKLLHFFDHEDRRYMVYHDHADYNPPGVFVSKESKWPTPPLTLCPCIEKSLSAIRPSRGRPESTAASGRNTATVMSSSCLSSSSSTEGEFEGKPSPAMRSGSPAALIAAAYLRTNPGTISHDKAAKLVEFAIARGAKASELEVAVTNPTAKGRKIWEVIETVTPKPTNGKSLDQVLDDWVKSKKTGGGNVVIA